MAKKEERHIEILHQLDMHNRVLLSDLSNMLHVSTDTVRRDITELDQLKKLKKVHGGAISLAFNISGKISEHNIYAAESKIIIAKKAAQLIKNNQVVLISGGTTNIELIRHLSQKLVATFFTPSLPIAAELLAYPNIEVIFIGGKLSKESQITMGGHAINTLAEMKVDICFLGTGYLDPINGLTEFDWEVVQMKKAMINASKKLYSLTISEKLNSMQRYKICETQTIDTLITELNPDDERLAPYTSQNIKIL